MYGKTRGRAKLHAKLHILNSVNPEPPEPVAPQALQLEL